MKTALTSIAMFVIITLIACSKDKAVLPKPAGIYGNWTIKQLYGNDFWGGPGYWKNTNFDIQVKFTNNGQYYRKDLYDDSLQLAGSFTLQPDSAILVVPAHPVNYDPAHPEWSDYSLRYSLQEGGFLVLINGNSEGIMEEKYISSH